MNSSPVYLDYHASTPADPRVVEEMLPYFTEIYGNAASRHHGHGWAAAQAVKRARQQVAALIGATVDQEIVFTSGATESNNLALRGVLGPDPRGKHIITSAIEHPCVLETVAYLESLGATCTRVGVDGGGVVRLQEIREAIRPETVLISIMTVNNEIGTIQPITAVGQLARAHGIVFHTDAAQAIGRVEIDVHRDHIDLLSLSGHKFYGPKGTGALYVRRLPKRFDLTAQMTGGGHEGGLRSGSLNVPGIVGLGKAAQLVREEQGEEKGRLSELTALFLSLLSEGVADWGVNGCRNRRVAGSLNLSFEGVPGEALLNAMPQLSFSIGSACGSGKATSSHVMRALGLSDSQANRAVRVSMGRMTTREEVVTAAGHLIEGVAKLRRYLGHDSSPRLAPDDRAGACS